MGAGCPSAASGGAFELWLLLVLLVEVMEVLLDDAFELVLLSVALDSSVGGM